MRMCIVTHLINDDVYYAVCVGAGFSFSSSFSRPLYVSRSSFPFIKQNRNFPDAATVNLGNGRTSEFHGSLLVTGNLDATTTGYSGRTVVLGNLVHNKGGSEFHSYDFNPPFPLPDPDDICEYDGTISFPGSSNGAQEAPPTVKPTVKPTNPPVPSGCKAKKNNGVGVTDSACAACKNGQTWWPCDMNPPMCEGTGCCKSKNFKGPC